MHIRITFSSSDYKYIYSRAFKSEQNDTNFKWKIFLNWCKF